MTTSLFLVFNHTFTNDQRTDAIRTLGVGRIAEMPPDVQDTWRNIPADLTTIDGYLKPVQSWLHNKAKQGDFVLIQGDFGACYIMVNFCFEKGLIPVYSTTARLAEEELQEDGGVKVTHRFFHRSFRKYER